MGAHSERWNPSALEGFLTEAQSLSGLVGLTIENWVVLQRNKFDVHANNEPHIGQTLYMEKATGRYLHRIFGRTIRDGRLDNPSGLKDLVQEIFEHSRMCQGFQDDVKVEPGITLDPGFHPYPRKVDPACQLVFKDPSHQAIVCPNCTRTLETDLYSVAEAIPDFVENITYIVGEQKEEPLEDFSFIDMNEPETSLWADQKPSKKIKYSEPDTQTVDKDDEVDDGENASEDGHLVTQGTDEELDSHVAFDHTQLDNVKTDINMEAKEKRQGIYCDHCNRTFANATYYRNHKAYLRRGKRRPQGKIPCKDCGKAHYSFDTLAKHMTEDHDQMLIDLDKYINHPQEVKAMKKPTRCSTCQIYLNGNVMVHRHRALFHELGDYQCADCNQHQLTYYHLVLHNYNEHSRVSPFLDPSTAGLGQVKHEDGVIELFRRKHVCPKCGKVFKYDGEWGKHMKSHHSWSLFNCHHCDELCHYAQDFVAHVQNFHSDNPEIKCPKCSEVFTLRGDPNCFEIHFLECARKVLVAGEKVKKPKRPTKRPKIPYQCDKCGKKYLSKYLFQYHLDSHAGVERHQCDKCDYATNVKSVMQDHRNFHLRAEGKTHDENGANLFFYCDQCPKKVSSRGSLNKHIKHDHEGVKRSFNCPDCDQVFNGRSTLYSHRRKAHGFVSNGIRRGKQDITL